MKEFPYLLPALFFWGGLAIGFGISWLLAGARYRRKLRMYRLEEESSKSLLSERLEARNNRIDELEAALREANGKVGELREMLRVESKGRSAAEAQLARLDETERLVKEQRELILQLQVENTELKTKIAEERKNIAKQMELLEKARQELSDTFRALSAEALKSNNQSFLTLARSIFENFLKEASQDLTERQKSIDRLVEPIKSSLERVDDRIKELEKARTEAYVSLLEQLKNVGETQKQLHLETANLVKALRMPAVRGRWGEIQLKRVVEIAGMVQYCDFVEQQSARVGDSRLRPDMIIQLPNNRVIIVDAKAPLQAYLESLETEDEQRKLEKLKEHAKQIRTHITMLSTKNYWQQFDRAPEFTVLFLPGEAFFSAALEHDPTLIEFGVDKNIVIATPTTLIALLRAVAYGWKQEQLASNARIISDLGKTLYERIRILAGHFSELRKNLERSVLAYNKTVRTLENRVLVTARKFKDLGSATGADIGVQEEIDELPRALKSPELGVND